MGFHDSVSNEICVILFEEGRFHPLSGDGWEDGVYCTKRELSLLPLPGVAPTARNNAINNLEKFLFFVVIIR